MPHGLYRDGDWVQVSYEGKQSMPMPRNDYEAAGYDPPFHELITKEQFDIHAKGVRFGGDA